MKLEKLLGRWVIWIGEGLGIFSAIREQVKIYLLHKLKIWTENKNCCYAHIAPYDFGYLRRWQSFIPFGNTMKVLPSQTCVLVRNFEKLHRELGWMDWAHLWYPYLTMLNTLPNCSSIGLSNKALPLQNFREGRNLHWIMCQIFELRNMRLGWN